MKLFESDEQEAEEEMASILCVDDEPNVLSGLQRALHGRFDVWTASSGAMGLETLREDGPFAVVVSDMQMPGMNGAAFLAQVREQAPDTVRMLLTGFSDFDAAIAAVNDGNIFRFLCKPCRRDVLVTALDAAMRQYDLVQAERKLLEETLGGAVSVLTELLGLAAPAAFARADQLEAYVAHMTAHIGRPDPWIYALAARLSQIGCVALPPDTLDKMYTGQAFSETEQSMLDGHPAIGHRLLARIPRLEPVAEIVGRQNDADLDALGDVVADGVLMLRVAVAIDALVAQGSSVRDAARKLRQRKGPLHPILLNAMTSFEGKERVHSVVAVRVRDLKTFMVLDEPVVTKEGTTVVAKDRQLTAPLIERLRNFASGVGVVEPIRVRIERG